MTRGPQTARDASPSLSGVVAGYGKGTGLGVVDSYLGSGERVGLLGRNGAGKTTLLRALMGLLPVRGGDIRFAGQPIRGMETFGIARLGIAYVPQGREIFPDFS